ncbi:MAG: 4-hydroxyphenylacetate 3-hydroxylase N-terminal domain-containing protein, partial [Pseudomonadota bacterium]
MTIRNGQAYRDALRDGRAVHIDGERVTDVTAHPAFRNAVASYAAMYDFQADPAQRDLMTVPLDDGRRVNRAWVLPRSHRELVERRKAIEAWSALSFGFLGRSPDHVASTLGGMMMRLDVLARGGKERAEAFAAYFERARREDLFVTYVIQNPQADKSGSAADQPRDVVLHVEREDDAGIFVRGAKMLGTSSIMSDEILVGHIQPLSPGEEDYALSFAIPVGTEGLKLLSRRSYERAASSAFDYPLSSNFDENDAVVWFDGVHVPWERVFVYRDTDLARAQWHDTPAHIFQNYQSQIRLSVKMRFLVALARRVAETNGADRIPQVRGTLGRLAAMAGLVEGMVAGMEAEGREVAGHVVPSASLLYSAQTLTQELYPQAIGLIRDLAGGGVVMLPSSERDLEDPDIRRMVEETQASPATDALGRIALMKLAWDAIGSEFASRHTQYEMFYGGASYVNHAHMWRCHDWASGS